jgi:hypothetical protein
MEKPGVHRSQERSAASRLNSCLLIDSTAMTPLPGPGNPEECHLYVAEGCHLYIATTLMMDTRLIMFNRVAQVLFQIQTGQAMVL